LEDVEGAVGEASDPRGSRERTRRSVAPEAGPLWPLFTRSPLPTWVYERRSLRFLAVNDAAVARYGWSQEEFFRRSLYDVRPEEEHERLRTHIQAVGPVGHAGVESWRHRDASGQVFPVELTTLPVRWHGVPAGLAQVRDMTGWIEAAEADRQVLERLAAMVRAAPSALVLLDAAGRVVWRSAGFLRVFGDDGPRPSDRPGDEVSAGSEGTPSGRAPADEPGPPRWEAVHPDDQARLQSELARLLSSPGGVVEAEWRQRDGRGRWRRVVGTAANELDNPAVRGIILDLHDVSQLREAEERLAREARTDRLTGLPNRLALEETLARLMADGVPPERRPAVVFLDLDDFKLVNDSEGHAEGDRLLVIVAERLRHVARPSDTIARFGGDEFVAVCPGLKDPDAAQAFGRRLVDALATPVRVAGRDHFVSASVGIALSETGVSGSELLARADAAMYRAKAGGRGQVALYDGQVGRSLAVRVAEGALMWRSWSRQALRVALQPIVDLSAERVVGLETFVRPEDDAMSARALVDAAERSGTMAAMGEWVLRAALCEAASWPASVAAWIVVKVSPVQLRDPARLAAAVDGALGESGFAPERLFLELQGPVGSDDVASLIEALVVLRERGVGVALDSFLAAGVSLGLDAGSRLGLLKLDRRVVESCDRPERRALLHPVVELAGRLGAEVVASGVERAGQARALRAAGCRLAEGFFFSPPVDGPAVPELFARTFPVA